MQGDATPPHASAVVHLTTSQLEELLSSASRRGAEQALAAVGLHDDAAMRDVVELRDLLETWRATRRGAFQAAGKLLAGVFLAGLVAALGGGALLRKLAGLVE